MSLNSLFVKRVVIVDIFATNEGSISITCSLFSLNLKGISLIDSFLINSISDYPIERLAKYPVIIILNGKGIVQKQTQISIDRNETSNLFQGINDDFYKSIYISSEYAGVSFCRRDYLEKHIDFFLNNHIPIIDAIIGTTSIIRFFERYTIDKSYIGHGYSYSNGLITTNQMSSTETDDEVDFLGSKVKMNLLLHYIIVLLFYIDGKVDLTFELPQKALVSRRNYLKQRKNFPIFSSFLFFLLILVLASSYIREKSSVKLAQLYQDMTSIERTISKEREQRTQTAEIINEAKKISLYFDEHPFILDFIGQTVPEDVTLKSIAINPITSKVVNNQEISFRNRVIVVEGVSPKPSDVTLWVNSINSERWIERVTIQSFTSNVAYYQFVLEIQIKDVE